MNIRITAMLDHGGRYFSAILTNEHSESICGLPVVVIDGEVRARRAYQVYCLGVSDSQMADLARRSGYLVLRNGSVHEESA